MNYPAKAKANRTYAIISFDDEFNVTLDDDSMEECIDQVVGSDLEVWKTREDGFHFVYCERTEIGYWVHPDLIDILKE